MCLLRLG
ncbi:hypothetical protein D030_3177A, partial [Vibrio parahaemolyticus AQ3810]